MIEANNKEIIEASNQDRDNTGIANAIIKARSKRSGDILVSTNLYQI